jgi:hypothetical protein
MGSSSRGFDGRECNVVPSAAGINLLEGTTVETRYVAARTPSGCEVNRIDGGGSANPLDPRLDLWNHSPTRFEWGYGGSGPAQLALALLADAAGERLAVPLHQQFKSDVVAKADRQGFELADTQIAWWVEQHKGTLDLNDWE